MGWPGPMTHRQFLGWIAWLEIEEVRPRKNEAYLMQIAKEVRSTVMANPETLAIGDFALVREGNGRRDRDAPSADNSSSEGTAEFDNDGATKYHGQFAQAELPGPATQAQIDSQRVRSSAFGRVTR